MLRHLQTINSKNVDATNKAKVDVKRGALVKKVFADKTFDLASDLKEVYFVDRDTKVTKDLAQGYVYSDYDAEQELVKAGEIGGLISLQKGERYATSEFDNALVDADVADKYVTATAGKIVVSPSNAETILKAKGFVIDNGNKLLIVEVVA